MRDPTKTSWHPLVVACAAMIGVRMLALTLHFLSNDPNGHQLYASPANALIIALPYHGALLCTTAAVLLALWRIASPLRPLITAAGVTIALTTILVGQVDLALQWFMGLRFVPVAAGTYIGGSMLSSNILAPLAYHPVYSAVAAVLILAGSVPILRALWQTRAGASLRMTSWRAVLLLLLVAWGCLTPIRWAYGFQRDTMRPPELTFLYHWIYPTAEPAPTDEGQAVAELRSLLDPAARNRWLDPRYPLLRAAHDSNARGSTVAPDQRPDIVLFAIESLRGADVGYVPRNYPPGESPTPHLDSLARHGVVFDHYISSGNPSPRGFFAIQTGVLDHGEALNTTGATNSQFDAIPARLRRAGYFTMGFWGANPSFDNQLFWANKWYDRLVFPSSPGRFVILRTTADDVLMDQVIDEIQSHDRRRSAQPFFAYIYPDGMHEPYTITGWTRLSDSSIRAIAAERDERKRYRLALRNLDAQIGRVLKQLQQRRTGRPLLILVTGDHSEVAGDVVPEEMFGLPHDALAFSALLLAGPQSIVGPTPRVEQFASSHLDLMPTLLNIIGDRGPTSAMGTDLRATLPDSQRWAIAVNHQGYRLDRNGWSLYVRREDTTSVFTRRVRAPLDELTSGITGSPFSPDDPRRLRDAFKTWSYLIERNRVWTPSALGDST